MEVGGEIEAVKKSCLNAEIVTFKRGTIPKGFESAQAAVALNVEFTTILNHNVRVTVVALSEMLRDLESLVSDVRASEWACNVGKVEHVIVLASEVDELFAWR